MLQIFKTTRDIMSLWKLSTKQYRRNQEAIRATNRQSIHHLRPWNSQFSIERHDVVETLQNQKSEKTTDYLGSAKKQNYETIVERHLEDEKLQVGMHGLDSRNPTWKNLTKIASEKRTYVASSDERAHFRDQYKVVQPYQRRNSDTVQTEEHPEHEHIVSSGKKNKWPDNPQNRCWTNGHRGLHGHCHLHRGLHGGILRHRKHGDNSKKNPTHLLSQHSSSTQRRRQTQSDLWRRNSSSMEFVLISSLSRATVKCRNHSCSWTHTFDALHTLPNFHGSKSDLQINTSSRQTLTCLTWVRR